MLTSIDELLESLKQIPVITRSLLLEPADDYTAFPHSIDASDREHVYNLLSPTAIETDDVIRESGMAADQVLAILLELEIAGRTMRHAGGRVSAL